MLSHKKTIISFASIFLILLLIIFITNKTDEINNSNDTTLATVHTKIPSDSSQIYDQYKDTHPANPVQESSIGIYQLKVDNNHTYYLSSIEEIESILNTIATTSMDNSIIPEVSIKTDSNQYEPIIEFSSQPILVEELTDRTFTTSSLYDHQDNSFETEALPSYSTGDKLVNLSFNETITIKSIAKETQTLSNTNDIVKELMKLNVEPNLYTIQTGDSASLIAEKNGMKLSDFYRLNPELKERERSLQIGEQVIAEKLIPELSIVSSYESTDTDSIPFDKEYREDDSIYIGLEVVSEVGSEGTLLITSYVDIINGEVINKEIIATEVIAEPQPQIILKGTKPVPKEGPAGFFITPLDSYRLTSSYGPRWGRIHRGIDMGTPTGTSVKASDGGTVIHAGWDSDYGYRIDIDHGNGKVTRYAHNSKLLVEYGQVVGQGEVIAKSGNSGNSTGPHLHFELTIDGTPFNPLDFFVNR